MIDALREQVLALPYVTADLLEYYMEVDEIVNHAYAPGAQGIYFINKDGSLSEFAEATDNPGYYLGNESVKKHVLYLPKEVDFKAHT